ncbi:selenocysteine-specific translation elongation factor [Billgrantia diversa]|uniref:selenocysteine-specific translation elongation factor n=1 Tax=Halomonas sp. MCCC 1A13316 TaxID=2733487 RepID=UPI0018A66096|nr:selenocysteine-specific translation elongation factor [Halomonas sp. MCCC 1A13316]QOR40583.1 selenocysteine-specific translation elongation factor [Halomonas sp. MCCC 1A13316]
MIVGTAGHVDHGKTALIQQLTGIDTDRLKEEKARGLTIEPGFAYPEMAGGVELGFVDVPGHARFLHHMLAGSAGVDTVLLVVAADDGIMPQTVEHLQILSLLGLDRGLVALTKIDRVDAIRRRQVREEIAALLSDTPLAGAPIVEASSHSGEGVEALRDRLWTLAATQRATPAQGHFRLAVDRVFTKSGTGLVVTGTAFAGDVSRNDEVRLVPAGLKARVRGLRRQHRDSERAQQGDRVALNLAGPGISREAIQRGDWIVAEALETPLLRRLDVQLHLLEGVPAVKHWAPIHVHLGVSRLSGRLSLLEGQRLAPGANMLGQLVLDEPVHACLGDRFVIRDPGGRLTLGGGVVLDGDPPRRGQRRPERLAWLSALTECAAAGPPFDLDPPLRQALERRPDGFDLVAMARNANADAAEMTARIEALGGRVVTAQGQRRAFSQEALAALQARLLDTLAANHEREPSMLGTERGRLARQTMPELPEPVCRELLAALVERGALSAHGPFVALPEHRAALSEADEALWQRLEPFIDAASFQPPRVRDLAIAADLDEALIRSALTACARLGRLYQVRRDHFYLAETVTEMAAILQALEQQHGRIRAAAFRDRIGTGRKLAIHILEFFDRVGYTRRIGDEREIRQAGMWQ